MQAESREQKSLKQKDHVPYKNIIFDIGDVLFSYDTSYLPRLERVFSPIGKGLEIAKRCHSQLHTSGTKKYRLFILSNFFQEYVHFLEQAFSDTFSLFEGIVASGGMEYKKPDSRIYHHTLDMYGLQASECIFIDDKQSNITAAQEVGMRGIVCTSLHEVENILEQLQII